MSYNIFDYPNTSAPSSTGWKTGLQYYSLLFVAEAFSTKQTKSNGTAVVDLNLNNTTAAAGYAVYDANALTSPPRSLVLFNFASGTSTQKFPLRFHLVPPRNINVRIRTLTAPTLTENSPTQVTYAGQTVNGNGDIEGTLSEESFRCQNECDIQVPGPGVALVFLQLEGKPSSRPQRYTAFKPCALLRLVGAVALGILLEDII